MKLYDIALKNVKGNLYRYIMYYLSNMFTVAVFYIFSSFLFHPKVRREPLAPNATVHAGAVNGIKICLIIIAIFTVLFVSYATSIFLKSRGKEFGLLSLFGMTSKQIRRYVFIERNIITALSIATGLLMGILFSKLFFMAMEAFMDISLPFYISLKALLLTVVLFFLLFEIVNLLSLFQIRSKEIVEQLKMQKIPKEIPKFSKFKSLLGLGLLIIGYVTAWIVDDEFVIRAMIPVVLIVVAGTYFIFTQFSILLANKLTNNKKIFYNRTNMVAFSQMRFKLKDTAKVLFLASILGAITFTATETIFSFFTEMPKIMGLNNIPQDIAIIQKGENLNDNLSIVKAMEILKDDGFVVEEYQRVKLIRVINEKEEYEDGHVSDILAISNSDYNKLASYMGKEKVQVGEGEVIYNYRFMTDYYDKGIVKNIMFPYEAVTLNINGESKEFSVKGEVHGSVTTLPNIYSDLIILNDEDYKEILKKAEEKDMLIFNGIHIDKWERSYKTSIKIQNMLGEKYEGFFYSKSIPYREERNYFGVALFIGFFVAFLFFIASGSIIYFKLFNEIKQDGIEYNILKKIGITKKEMKGMITKQIAVIFFLPFIVSTMHSLFALKSLSNLLDANLLKNGLIVMAGYFICQGIYFLIIRKIYINKIEDLSEIATE
jgi:putative ABC transport system permease protein